MKLGPRVANYFDNAATTPLDPRVLSAMLPFLGEEFGNASSIHSWGRTARQAVENAREQAAKALGVSPDEITFTSGATESNNWVLSSFSSGVISPFEHPSIREPALLRGWAVADFNGLQPMPLASATRKQLQSLMLVNNETGTAWTQGFEIGGDFRHSDVTQALGKLDIEGWMRPSGCNAASASAHKVYGPKGVGLVASSFSLPPLLAGGGQENGLRSGTLNVPGIVGFGEACRIAQQERESDWNLALTCREIVLESLSGISDWRVNGVLQQDIRGISSVPHILSLSFLGLEGESLVIEADNAGFAISAGAACSSASTEPSVALKAMGVSEAWIRGTIRISFGRFSSPTSANDLGKMLANGVNGLRALQNGP